MARCKTGCGQQANETGYCNACQNEMDNWFNQLSATQAEEQAAADMADMAHEAHVTLPSDWRREY